jgi:hypothetical protein
MAAPFTYLIVNFLKKVEKPDYYDFGSDFNPLKLKDVLSMLCNESSDSWMEGGAIELSGGPTCSRWFF